MNLECSYAQFRTFAFVRLYFFVLDLTHVCSAPPGLSLVREFWRRDNGRRTDDGQTIVKNLELDGNLDNGAAFRFSPATT